MQHHGILLLETLADPIPPILEIHTYVATSWTGEPTECVLSPPPPSPSST